MEPQPAGVGIQPLTQIDKDTVKKLRVIVPALHATKRDLLWSHERKLPPRLPTLAYGDRAGAGSARMTWRPDGKSCFAVPYLPASRLN